MCTNNVEDSTLLKALNAVCSLAFIRSIRPAADNIDVPVCPPATGMVAVSMTDYGIGISPEEHGNIFGQFYRVGGCRNKPIPGLVSVCLSPVKS